MNAEPSHEREFRNMTFKPDPLTRSHQFIGALKRDEKHCMADLMEKELDLSSFQMKISGPLGFHNILVPTNEVAFN